MTGYRDPPASTRWQPGQSGNSKGRPRGRHNRLPYAVLDQIVTIRDGDVERRTTAEEAFLLLMTKRGLEGDATAARAILAGIEDARAASAARGVMVVAVDYIIAETGSVTEALRMLRMATKVDRYEPTARTMLEPTVVQDCVDQLGDKRFSVEEQCAIYKAVRTPQKVRWPHWWEFFEQ